jgi:very-short-patch-repair endonuclease
VGTVRDGRQDDELGLGVRGFADDGDGARAEDEGGELSAGADGDGLARPVGDGLAGGDDEDAGVALVAGADAGDVGGPGEALAWVGGELHLEHDGEHGLAVAQEDDEVGAQLGGVELGEVGGLDPGLGVVRERDVQRRAHQLGGERGPLSEERDESLVQVGRRHGGTLPRGRGPRRRVDASRRRRGARPSRPSPLAGLRLGGARGAPRSVPGGVLDGGARSTAPWGSSERVTPPAPWDAEARPGGRAREVVMRTPHAVIVARAAAFRAAPTTTEALLWEALRAGKLGVRFRRQVVLGRYIADFVAPQARSSWSRSTARCTRGRCGADARRDRDLGRMGYRVLRLPRALVQQRLQEAVALVVAALPEVRR